MKRTTRRRLTHAALYVLLALLVLGAWWAVDWPAVANSFFRVDVIRAVWLDFLLIGAVNTVTYTAIAFGGKAKVFEHEFTGDRDGIRSQTVQAMAVNLDEFVGELAFGPEAGSGTGRETGSETDAE